MHLPSHIANLNLLSEPTPAQSPFRTLYPSADPPAVPVDDSLKQHLDLWINTEFSWSDDADSNKGNDLKDKQADDLDYYTSRVAKASKEKNVLQDQKLGVDTEQHKEQKQASPDLASFLSQYYSFLSPESLQEPLTSQPTTNHSTPVNTAAIKPAADAFPVPHSTPILSHSQMPSLTQSQNQSQNGPQKDNLLALLSTAFPTYPQAYNQQSQTESYPRFDYPQAFSGLSQGFNLDLMNSVGTNFPPAQADMSNKKRKLSDVSRDNSAFASTSTNSNTFESEQLGTDEWQGPLAEGVTAEEDKRRRNTAASARFRMKKKEREQALERHAKELEEKVAKMAREMEGLQKENGWLKALLINGAPQPLSAATINAEERVRHALGSTVGVGTKQD